MEHNDQHNDHANHGHKRRRARKACIPCRQRKRKCDANSPCEMCSTYGYTCQYDEDDSPLAPFVAQPAKRSRVQDSDAVHSPSSSTPKNLSDTQHADSPSNGSTRRRQRSPFHAHDAGMLDEQKARYVGVSSAVAFPRVLGLELKSKNPPALHSFGYNFGIRPEEKSNITGTLSELISEEDLNIFANMFFSSLGPIFDLLDQRVFIQRCRDYYKGSSGDVGFSAVAANVAAIGSFLSTNQGHAQELDIVQYGKMVLEDPASTRRPSVDQVVGWSLRGLYLRATTRPNNTWLASCITMHLAEALGLHEEENIKKLATASSAAAIGYDAERLRRIFWTSWANHVITCHEYGRSAVRFPTITCENLTPVIGSHAHLQVALAQIIPCTNSPFRLPTDPEDLRDDICQRIKALREVPTGHPFIALTRADLIFCFYRRMRQSRMSVTNEVVEQIIAAGNEAVEAAEQFVREGRPFWNILGSVFQYACVLLAIDTQASLSNIATAFQGLEAIVNAADTKLTREALITARLLLKDTISKKRSELSDLEAVDAREMIARTGNAEPQLEIPADLNVNVNWDQIFDEPYESLLGTAELMGYAQWANGVQ